jgi:hypothetical protein
MPVTDGNDSEQLGILKDQLNVKADDIRAFCKKNNLTVNAFFTAAFGMAVKSYSAAEETIFSTIYNGRSDARLENSVSMLVKTFPVYFNPKQDANIVSVIKDTQSYLLNAMSNDIYSFAEVKNEYGINGDMIFAYQGDIDDIAIIGGFKSSYKLLNLSRFRMPIGIDVFLCGDKVIYESEYAPSLYSEYTIQGIINLLDVVSQEFVSKDKLSDISLVSDSDIKAIEDAFAAIPAIYIADGHHRAASAVRVGQKRREAAGAAANASANSTAAAGSPADTIPYEYFLSVLFPDEELRIYDYNRVVKDLNSLSAEELKKQIEADCIEARVYHRDRGML